MNNFTIFYYDYFMEADFYSNVSYERTFLSQVIIRLDFLDFISSEFLFDEDIIKAFREIFPKVSMRQMMSFNDVQVNLALVKPEATFNAIEGFSQTFTDQTNNKLIVSNKYIILEINHYTNFEDTFNKLDFVIKVLGTDNMCITRTGIRYINIYEEGQVKLAKKLFNNPIGALVNTNLSQVEGNTMCIRSMCMNEYRVGDMRLNFRYGMFNPQYPNAMRSASFALDYDCYCESLIRGYDEIKAHIRSAHKAIQELFEKSISESLRTIMNNG